MAEQNAEKARINQYGPSPEMVHFISRLVKTLGELDAFYSPYEALSFLMHPQQVLGGEMPAEMIAKGNHAVVDRMLASMRDGSFL
jgi:uncharacterized protein (DUF2384 family)